MNMTNIIKKDEYVYECASCGSSFKAAEIKLITPTRDFTISTAGYKVMCVERNGDLRSKPNPKQRDGDKLLACPRCDHIHLNGFNLKGLNRKE